MSVTLYGIANCDKVRKARAFLDEQGVGHVFHDYRKAGLDRALLERFADAFGWEALINRKGTTWRRLPEADRDAVTDKDSALALLLDNPSAIKRPILNAGDQWLIGFEPASWSTLR
ncbi:MAG: ArsC family reductase [Stappia sp.]|uniref:ArsC family reductase n=1 Tax=Stappia sp. TaxID=1870903 RepID=UPI000C4D93B9|nr:ArsC family reductase [Stappia sp.]MAA98920.1 ArsC family reductase [Stappia sp.]MBM21535.1 ArsC family reductase [Stappia sp.]